MHADMKSLKVTCLERNFLISHAVYIGVQVSAVISFQHLRRCQCRWLPDL